ncbi:DUF7503 family protein [Haloterrigena turkmenica]
MDDLTQHLKNHPRMIGVLFTIAVALSQAGTAAAGAGAGFTGI